MSDLYWLTDDQMARLQPYFPKSHGKPQNAPYVANFRFTLLALLWQVGIEGRGQQSLAVRTSGGWRSCEEIEDGLPNRRHARLRRRAPDSFFSVPLP